MVEARDVTDSSHFQRNRSIFRYYHLGHRREVVKVLDAYTWRYEVEVVPMYRRAIACSAG